VACSDRSCTLDAGSSTASEGPIASYDWAFGDGASGEGQTVSHEYAEDGRYRVTLKVTGGNETSATRSRTIQIVTERAIELRAAGGRQNGRGIAVLTWSEAGTDTVIIRRNGQQIAEVPNTGKYRDTDLASLRKTAAYQVCDANGTNCSEEIVVMLGPVWGLKAPEDKQPPAKVRH
jgi:PKD repeat protein